MKNLKGLCALVGMVYAGSLVAYVPRGPLVPDVIKFSKQQPSQQGNVSAESVVAVPEQNFAPVRIEERDGFACINGFEAFDQVVVKASHAYPVVVLIFASRSTASQQLWQQLLPLAQKVDKGERFVAIDIFQKSEGEQDNQNYQIALGCMLTVGLQSFPLPVVLFFKDGMMCSAKEAVLMGDDIRPEQVAGIVAQIMTKKAKF